MTNFYDLAAVQQTVKLSTSKDVAITLIKNDTERWRFLVPFADSTETYENTFANITPYKRSTLLDFQGRSPDTLELKNCLLTTRTQERSIQPLIDSLKSCLIPDYAVDESIGKDDLDPPKLNLVWGDLLYKDLYLKRVGIDINRDDRLNGYPIKATVSLSFITSIIITAIKNN
jgi:hypothetical protein